MPRIHLFSDTHNEKFNPDPTADFAIHSGDITNKGFYGNITYNKSIKSLIESPIPIYYVPGNHDIKFRHDTDLGGNSINVLEKTKEVCGLTIRGVSLSTCYNLPHIADIWDHMTCVESEEEEYYSLFLDKYYDIVVSHSPPNGDIGSEIECGDIGSRCLTEYIEEYQPKLVVCGHVHKALTRRQMIGDTIVINVARRNEIIEL